MTDNREKEIRSWVAEIRDLLAALDDVRRENAALVEVARAADSLFAAMDYTIGEQWRDETLVCDEDSDEVNHAWVALDKALKALRQVKP